MGRRGIRRILRDGVGFQVGLRTGTREGRCLQSFLERRRRRRMRKMTPCYCLRSSDWW